MKLAQRKLTRERQNEICAAHDISPLFEAAFGLDWSQLKLEMAGSEFKNMSGEKKGLGATLKRIKNATSPRFGKKSDGDEK